MLIGPLFNLFVRFKPTETAQLILLIAILCNIHSSRSLCPRPFYLVSLESDCMPNVKRRRCFLFTHYPNHTTWQKGMPRVWSHRRNAVFLKVCGQGDLIVARSRYMWHPSPSAWRILTFRCAAREVIQESKTKFACVSYFVISEGEDGTRKSKRTW